MALDWINSMVELLVTSFLKLWEENQLQFMEMDRKQEVFVTFKIKFKG